MRWQLLLWQMLLLSVVLVVLLSLHYYSHRRMLIAQTDTSLQHALTQVLPVIAPADRPFPRHPSPELDVGSTRSNPADRPFPRQPSPRSAPIPPISTGLAFLDRLESENMFVAVWGPHGELIQAYGTGPAVSLADYDGFKQKQQFVSRDGYRQLVMQHDLEPLIVIGKRMTTVSRDLAATRNTLIIVGCATFLLALAGGWFIIQKNLRPIQVISRTAGEIAAGQHDLRIECEHAPEELQRLAHILNSTFDHLDQTIERQKQFSADASHELRTPIAVIIAQAQTILKRERNGDEYRAAITACLRAGERMGKLVNSLLEISRIDSGSHLFSMERSSLHRIVSEAVDAASLLSEKHPITYQPAETQIELDLDRIRIHQVCMNLLTNAINHNPGGCAVCVSLKREHDRVVLTIADDGVGVPPEAIDHIFDRFFRVDKSRSRQRGGSGLGLSIVQTIVESHGGTISAAHAPRGGIVFTIQLPLGSARERNLC